MYSNIYISVHVLFILNSSLVSLSVCQYKYCVQLIVRQRTEKYPIENEYSSYLSDHGGYSNAYTSQEDTVYYFDVQNEFFEGALDLFASFFVCPLFTETATEREINVTN